MTVGIDVRTFSPQAGQARYLWRLGGWLGERGHRVHLICVRRGPEEVEDIDAPSGVRLHPLQGVSRSDLRRYVADLELEVLLINPERTRHLRGVHANLLRPGYGTEHYSQKLASFRSPLGYGARKLLRSMPWVLAEKRWERAFYEDPDPPPDVIANSHYMRGQILKSYDIPESRVHVIYNGIDPEEFSPEERARLRPQQRAEWGVPENATCMLFLGHNFRLKGLWQMLEVVARLRSEGAAADLRLLVAGRGTGRGQRRKADRLIRKLGLEGAVHMLGSVQPPIRALAAADFLVHLSWHDSFGFVVLEAMAAGIPVVTTPFAGASELVDDGRSGILVYPGSQDEVQDAVRRLLDDEERR
ncbi:MAG: glycosyltransferase family 4 protein, partial [Longimicrobiales bacterium]|nr:glycosyltransferase family 4 protein [Longimicrobiales bacterium]